VDALRLAGYSVEVLSDVGRGCTDLIVGYPGGNLLMEVKQPGQSLNALQLEWHRRWRGDVAVVESAEEALAELRARTGRQT
jgi:hypothetical protein